MNKLNDHLKILRLATFDYRNKSLMKNTFCIFNEVDSKIITAKKSDYTSASKSQYFFTEDGVFRYSDHWGRTANSKWRLVPMDEKNRKFKTGFALWTDFHKDNDFNKLYFIEVDFELNAVYFNHKNNLKTSNKAILRTTSETTKIIRQIRNLLQNDAWTKYFYQKDIKQRIVMDLIHSDETLVNIKQKYLKQVIF